MAPNAGQNIQQPQDTEGGGERERVRDRKLSNKAKIINRLIWPAFARVLVEIHNTQLSID